MINLIIASSIRLLFYMNLVGSIFLFLSIGATHLFSKQLAPKHKLLFCKVNIFLFLLPVPLLTNYYKRLFSPFMMHPKPTDKIPVDDSIRIVQNHLVLRPPNISIGILIGLFLCISIMLFRAIYIRRLYIQTKNFCSTIDSDFNFKEFIQPNQAIITNLSRDLRLSKSPILSLSDHISIPFVTGLWNTKLFLPLSFNLSDDTNYLIIKHELAHLKHHDNLFKLTLMLLSVLFWYNPCIYLLIQFYQNTSELAADDLALMNCTLEQKRNYGNALLKYSSTPPHLSLVSSSGFTFHQKNILKERITHLKKHTAHKHPIFTSIVTELGIIFLSFSSSLTILAYNTPAVEIDNIHSLEEVLNEEKNISETEGFFSVIDEEEDTFLFSDSYFTDENGTSYNVAISDVDISEKKLCKHTYVSGTYTRHDKKTNGSCKVLKYQAQRCSSCQNLVLGNLISSLYSAKCPH